MCTRPSETTTPTFFPNSIPTKTICTMSEASQKGTNEGKMSKTASLARTSSRMHSSKRRESFGEAMCQRIGEVTSTSCSEALWPGRLSSACITKVRAPCVGTLGHANVHIGRARGLLELDLKLDDLLEMQKDNQEDLDLEYVQFNVSKVLALLNRRFSRKKGW